MPRPANPRSDGLVKSPNSRKPTTLAGGFGTERERGKLLQTQEEYIQYGTYTPFSVTVFAHLLNNKSGTELLLLLAHRPSRSGLCQRRWLGFAGGLRQH